jgi:hypothetical protein
VKLFVSALILAAASAAFAQNQSPARSIPLIQPGQDISPQQKDALQKDALEKASGMTRAEVDALLDRMSQTGCPLYMKSASVAPEGGYLPVTAQNRQDGVLDLHFRNQSGKPIASVAITAQVSVKTNIYALDAHSLQLRLTMAGTQDLDKTLDQFQHIVLPPHVYLFGVARVTLDQVTYADGSVWTASPSSNACRTGPVGMEQIAK